MTGLNLTLFFQEWFYSCGYPTIKATMTHKKEERQVVISLEQTQVDSAKHIPLFHCSVDVEVIDEDGNVFRGSAAFRDHSKKTSVVLDGCDKAPAQVRIDPDGKLLFTLDFNHGETTLGNVARDGKDVVSRIRAYYELIKIGTPTAMSIVHEGILKEPFYGVRVKGRTLLFLLFLLLEKLYYLFQKTLNHILIYNKNEYHNVLNIQNQGFYVYSLYHDL